ncbi:carboxypeptidase Q-like isoform X2 [Belonocnema kinseyi]|nr:carboxypeptidase Q-like isoform X2 [Belonocnema kinseyi]
MLILPRQKDIAVLGLGYSVGTPAEGIIAEAIVVKSLDELKKKEKEITGKIVVYNQDFELYEKAVKYRYNGANEAAKLGAVAVLVRAITPVSLYTLHAGSMKYAENITKIPAASITVEDAELLYRFQNRGETLKIQLKMEAKMLPDVESRNLVVELTGNKKPEKVVVVSSHIDSWDVGQGAMDDGGGAFISWSSLVLLKRLNLRPQRTIRGIMWTAEEIGLIGSRNYIKKHEEEKKNLQFVLDSDLGTFKPQGLVVSGNEQVQCIVHRILRLLKPLGNLNVKRGVLGYDTLEWLKGGVPGASLWNQNDTYFWYHHTNADTMLVEDPSALDAGTALFAAVSYVLADISIDLPHGNLS